MVLLILGEERAFVLFCLFCLRVKLILYRLKSPQELIIGQRGECLHILIPILLTRKLLCGDSLFQIMLEPQVASYQASAKEKQLVSFFFYVALKYTSFSYPYKV